jgi:hypothetical protein
VQIEKAMNDWQQVFYFPRPLIEIAKTHAILPSTLLERSHFVITTCTRF